VMVPRTEMIAVSSNATLEDIIQLYLEHSFTKLPVYGRNLDQVLGIVHLNDLLSALHGELQHVSSAQDLMREAIFIPETARVSGLLRLFRDRQQHIAIVLDEYGGTAGIVTLEDLLEEIIGEVDERFGLSLNDPDYITVAGFVIGKLGRLAQVGDVINAEGLRFQVEAMDGLRIARLSIRKISDTRSPSKPHPKPAD
jgi:putative hemolysin